jgi:hypothetical protein
MKVQPPSSTSFNEAAASEAAGRPSAWFSRMPVNRSSFNEAAAPNRGRALSSPVVVSFRSSFNEAAASESAEARTSPPVVRSTPGRFNEAAASEAAEACSRWLSRPWPCCFNEAAASEAAEVPAQKSLRLWTNHPSRRALHWNRWTQSSLASCSGFTMSNSPLLRKRYLACERCPGFRHHTSARVAAARARGARSYITIAVRVAASKLLPRLSTLGSTLSAGPRSRMGTQGTTCVTTP